jgi:hypothetical protein
MKWILWLLIPLASFAVPNPPNRPSKAPFVSGDGFRAIADYVFDEVDSSLSPQSVKPQSSIFVKPDLLDRFFHAVHPLIPHPYVLITHNADAPMPDQHAHFADDPKIIAWFGQNYDGTPHPKLHPIPIGIANYCWPHGHAETVRMVRDMRNSKKHLVHMNISIGTFPQERGFVYNHFCSMPSCFHPEGKPFMRFLTDVASSKFEVAPRGNGLDTHRLWESLYLGTIPIVKTCSLDCLYAGLPVLIVQQWSDVTEEFLERKYKEFSAQTFNLEKLSMDYWAKEIDICKRF